MLNVECLMGRFEFILLFEASYSTNGFHEGELPFFGA